ncbi:MAG: hypothetical protein ABIY55_02020 [Kofleriaceae bacterium]
MGHIAEVGGSGIFRPLEAIPLPVPDYQRMLGTADPIRVIASANNGRWVVACQARIDTDGDGRTRVEVGTDSLEGDAMVPYLFRGGGGGDTIDGLLARSRDDRWLAILRDGALVVIDDTSGTASVVSDADTQPGPRGIAGLVAFDDESRRLVYFRRSTARRVVVIRDLMQQRERDVALARPVGRLIADRQGTWAGLQLAPDELHRTVRRRLPAPSREAAMGQTCGTEASYPITALDEDRVPDAWLRLDTGELVFDRSVVGHVGGLQVAKATDGGIRVGSSEFVPATCGAEVVMASARPLRLIVACRAVPGAPLELFGPRLQVAFTGSESYGTAPGSIRVLDGPVFCLDSFGCVALDDGRRIPVRGTPSELDGMMILSKEGEQFFVTDGATASTTVLRGVAGDERAHTRNIVAIDHHVIDLAEARVLGEVPGFVLQVDTAGRALVPGPESVGRGDQALGPLRWATPRATP